MLNNAEIVKKVNENYKEFFSREYANSKYDEKQIEKDIERYPLSVVSNLLEIIDTLKQSGSADSQLIQALNEVHDWKYVTGDLPENTMLRLLAKENEMSIADIQQKVIEEGHDKFKKIIPLLIADKPTRYIKTFNT